MNRFPDPPVPPAPSPVGAAGVRLPRRSESVLCCDAGGELLLYDGMSQTAVSLNLTAAVVWDLCDGTTPVAEIIARIADATGDDPRTREGEIQGVLNDFEALGLLVTEVPDAPELGAG